MVCPTTHIPTQLEAPSLTFLDIRFNTSLIGAIIQTQAGFRSGQQQPQSFGLLGRMVVTPLRQEPDVPQTLLQFQSGHQSSRLILNSLLLLILRQVLIKDSLVILLLIPLAMPFPVLAMLSNTDLTGKVMDQISLLGVP